jgi:hypothetical protein
LLIWGFLPLVGIFVLFMPLLHSGTFLLFFGPILLVHMAIYGAAFHYLSKWICRLAFRMRPRSAWAVVTACIGIILLMSTQPIYNIVVGGAHGKPPQRTWWGAMGDALHVP